MILFNRTLSFEHTAATANGLTVDGLQQELVIFRRAGFSNVTALQDAVNYAPTTTISATNYTLDQPLQIVSSSTADRAVAGTGVKTVRVSGVLDSGLLATEDVNLNGTTPVSLITNFRNVNRMVVVDAVSANGLPAGIITLRPIAAPTTTFLQISLSTTSESSLFTVPSDAKAVITNLILSVTHATSTVVTRVCVLKSEVPGVFVPICDLTIMGSITTQLNLNLSLKPLDTIKLAATPSASQTFSRVSGSMELVLIKI